MPAARLSSPQEPLTRAQIDGFVAEQLTDARFDDARVCVIIPDSTRSCPLATLLDAVHSALHGRVRELTVLIALGTHAAMSQERIERMLEVAPGGLESRYPGTVVRNHEWWNPESLVVLGTIDAATLSELSEGRLCRSVDVVANRAVVDHDEVVIISPVFPHEVVGFSGGNKYLFPGISGQEMIDVSHWLGALISSADIIGTRGTTPVRALIDRAAGLVPAHVTALCVVVRSGSHDLLAMSYGDSIEAWREAADVSAQVHIETLEEPVDRVVSVMPDRYDEIWTAAKGMYKVEPVVADGGEVIIYAPGIDVVSHTHAAEIAAIGYHCRDYFTAQWDSFAQHPWGVLAHSTHLRGAGTWDPEHGERPRVTVTLATGISREDTEALGLSYRDPSTIDLGAEEDRPDTLVVRNAGEVLFRLRSSLARSRWVD